MYGWISCVVPTESIPLRKLFFEITMRTNQMDQLSFMSGMKAIDRRLFIKYLSAVGAVSAFGSLEAKAISSKAKGKIVVVGGGAAGISTSARLNRWLESPDITLIDPSEVQFYQPGFTLIGGGVYNADEVTKTQSSCIPSGVKWVKDSVTGIDPVSNKVYTAGNGVIPYDFLLLTPGLQMNFNAVEGISRETLGLGNAHCIYDYQGAQKTWKAIQELSKKGGKAVYTNTYTKLKCGGAPKKIALMTEHYCRLQGTRANVELSYFNASKDLFDTPYYATRLIEIFEERKISHNPSHRLRAVDTQSKVAHFDLINKRKKEVKDEVTGVVSTVEETEKTPVSVEYDFLHFVPPMSAPDFVREAGLGWTSGDLQRDAWVMVDKETFVHQTYKNIISLGDVAGMPTSKTSAAIRIQSPIAAKNMISLMEGKEPVEKYNGYTACPIVTEYGKVLLAEFDYNKTPMPSIPFVDSSKEQWAAWILKKYILKPVYFYGMLNGIM